MRSHDRRRRLCRAGQHARQVRLHAKLFDGVRRGVLIAGIDLAEFGLRRRLRHQHADRRRFDRALWRRRLPRQQSVDTQSARELKPARVPPCAGIRVPCRSCDRPNRGRRRAARWRTSRCRAEKRIRIHLGRPSKSPCAHARRTMAISISIASAAAKKRVNRPTMMQIAPTVSRNMAALAKTDPRDKAELHQNIWSATPASPRAGDLGPAMDRKKCNQRPHGAACRRMSRH